MGKRSKIDKTFILTPDKKMLFPPIALSYVGACPGGKFRFVDTVPEATEVLARRQKLPIAVDIETSGLDCFTDNIYLMSLAFTNTESVVLDVRQLFYDDPGIREQIQRFLICNKFVIHNSLFEQMFFKSKFGVFASLEMDTQVMNEVATAGLPERSSLGEVSKFYLDVDVNKDWQKGFADLAPYSPYPQEAIEYAAGDVTRLLQLSYLIKQRLIKDKLWDVWEQIELPFLQIVAEAKYRGIGIDTSVLETLRGDILCELEQHGRSFSEHYPNININSSQQIAELLVNLGNKVENSDKECLTKIITNGSVASKFAACRVLGYRGVKKIMSTYIEPLTGKHLNSVTKKLHPSWRPNGTDTGRMACREPNVMNIPLGGIGGRIRSAFVAGTGNSFVVADYSQFELRALANASREPLMVNAFRHGEDLHSQTAALLFGPDFTKDQRKLAKTFNFAIAYGAGPPALAAQTEISIKLAQELYDKYFRSYPTLASYLRRSNQYAKDYGESSSPFGRKRFYTRPSPDDEGYKWKCEAIGRAGVNHPIQSCNGDSIKIASIQISKRLQGFTEAGIVMWIHDEIVVECKSEDAEVIAGIVEQEMVEAATRFITEVPIEVAVSIGERWEK